MRLYTRYTVHARVAMISVRIDDATRKAMDRVKGVNWSEVARRAIREAADEALRKNKVKALLTFEALSRKPPKGFDSTKVIRYWREQRYGPSRRRR